MQEFALIGSDSALENVMLPFYFDNKASLKKAKELALSVLSSVGMDSMAAKPVNKLSGASYNSPSEQALPTIKPSRWACNSNLGIRGRLW